MKIPENGTQWKHKSGTIYKVVCVTNKKATKEDYPVTVVYEDSEGDLWSRTLVRWQEMEEVDKK